jgi:hypothetical protein
VKVALGEVVVLQCLDAEGKFAATNGRSHRVAVQNDPRVQLDFEIEAMFCLIGLWPNLKQETLSS